MNKKKVIVYGATGQDGAYLSRLLVSKDFEVHGITRRTSSDNLYRLKELNVLNDDCFFLHTSDISDFGSVYTTINTINPEWVINLAAQSHVGISFHQPNYTFQVNTVGVNNILDVIRNSKLPIRSYHAMTSEMFGDSYDCSYNNNVMRIYQNEQTKLNPQSPYAISKVAAFHMCKIYRQGYGQDVRTGILFNHESEYRGEEFVTRKVTKYLGYLSYCKNNRIKNIKKLRLGNLEAVRDWGHAEDYVEAIYNIMLCDKADDYVVSTGQSFSVKEFIIQAFKYAGFEPYTDFIISDPLLVRPCEVPYLEGDSSYIKAKLGWRPNITFQELVKRMVDYDRSHFSPIDCTKYK